MSEKQKIFFITYGSSEFNISKKHLINLAKYSNIFDECIDYSFKDLSTDFKKKYSNIEWNRPIIFKFLFFQGF